MNCSKIMDMVYDEEPMPLVNQIQVSLHAFFCPACAQEIEQYQAARSVLKIDFFPAVSEYLEESIMTKIEIKEKQAQESYNFQNAIPGGLSTRGWVITGLIIMISLVTAFFGLDFRSLADESGMSFMLPMGITIGIVLTTYGALFIGSHLKELSERFGL